MRVTRKVYNIYFNEVLLDKKRHSRLIIAIANTIIQFRWVFCWRALNKELLSKKYSPTPILPLLYVRKLFTGILASGGREWGGNDQHIIWNAKNSIQPMTFNAFPKCKNATHKININLVRIAKTMKVLFSKLC